MEELNLYDDLDEFQEQQEKKSKELQELEEKYQQSLKTIEDLQKENKTLKKNIKTIELNFQSLLDTARAEIRRKNKEIDQLRKEKDDIVFRRKPSHKVESQKRHLVADAVVSPENSTQTFKDTKYLESKEAFTLQGNQTNDDKAENISKPDRDETFKRNRSQEGDHTNDNKRLKNSRDDRDYKYGHERHKDHYSRQSNEGNHSHDRRKYETAERNHKTKSPERHTRPPNRSRSREHHRRDNNSPEKNKKTSHRESAETSRPYNRSRSREAYYKHDKPELNTKIDHSNSTERSNSYKRQFDKSQQSDRKDVNKYAKSTLKSPIGPEDINSLNDKLIQENKAKNKGQIKGSISDSAQNVINQTETFDQETENICDNHHSTIGGEEYEEQHYGHKEINSDLKKIANSINSCFKDDQDATVEIISSEEDKTNNSEDLLSITVKHSSNENQSIDKPSENPKREESLLTVEASNLGTPCKVALFNEIFGQSSTTTTTPSSSTKSLFNNIKGLLANITSNEVITTATSLSPGDCTEASDHNETTKTKVCKDNIKGNEMDKGDTTVKDLTKVMEDDTANEIQSVQIPGLDLCGESVIEKHDFKTTGTHLRELFTKHYLEDSEEQRIVKESNKADNDMQNVSWNSLQMSAELNPKDAQQQKQDNESKAYTSVDNVIEIEDVNRNVKQQISLQMSSKQSFKNNEESNEAKSHLVTDNVTEENIQRSLETLNKNLKQNLLDNEQPEGEGLDIEIESDFHLKGNKTPEVIKVTTPLEDLNKNVKQKKTFTKQNLKDKKQPIKKSKERTPIRNLEPVKDATTYLENAVNKTKQNNTLQEPTKHNLEGNEEDDKSIQVETNCHLVPENVARSLDGIANVVVTKQNIECIDKEKLSEQKQVSLIDNQKENLIEKEEQIGKTQNIVESIEEEVNTKQDELLYAKSKAENTFPSQLNEVPCNISNNRNDDLIVVNEEQALSNSSALPARSLKLTTHENKEASTVSDIPLHDKIYSDTKISYENSIKNCHLEENKNKNDEQQNNAKFSDANKDLHKTQVHETCIAGNIPQKVENNKNYKILNEEEATKSIVEHHSLESRQSAEEYRTEIANRSDKSYPTNCDTINTPLEKQNISEEISRTSKTSDKPKDTDNDSNTTQIQEARIFGNALQYINRNEGLETLNRSEATKPVGEQYSLENVKVCNERTERANAGNEIKDTGTDPDKSEVQEAHVSGSIDVSDVKINESIEILSRIVATKATDEQDSHENQKSFNEIPRNAATSDRSQVQETFISESIPSVSEEIKCSASADNVSDQTEVQEVHISATTLQEVAKAADEQYPLENQNYSEEVNKTATTGDEPSDTGNKSDKTQIQTAHLSGRALQEIKNKESFEKDKVEVATATETAQFPLENQDRASADNDLDKTEVQEAHLSGSAIQEVGNKESFETDRVEVAKAAEAAQDPLENQDYSEEIIETATTSGEPIDTDHDLDNSQEHLSGSALQKVKNNESIGIQRQEVAKAADEQYAKTATTSDEANNNNSNKTPIKKYAISTCESNSQNVRSNGSVETLNIVKITEATDHKMLLESGNKNVAEENETENTSHNETSLVLEKHASPPLEPSKSDKVSLTATCLRETSLDLNNEPYNLEVAAAEPATTVSNGEQKSAASESIEPKLLTVPAESIVPETENEEIIIINKKKSTISTDKNDRITVNKEAPLTSSVANEKGKDVLKGDEVIDIKTSDSLMNAKVTESNAKDSRPTTISEPLTHSKDNSMDGVIRQKTAVNFTDQIQHQTSKTTEDSVGTQNKDSKESEQVLTSRQTERLININALTSPKTFQHGSENAPKMISLTGHDTNSSKAETKLQQSCGEKADSDKTIATNTFNEAPRKIKSNSYNEKPSMPPTADQLQNKTENIETAKQIEVIKKNISNGDKPSNLENETIAKQKSPEILKVECSPLKRYHQHVDDFQKISPALPDSFNISPTLPSISTSSPTPSNFSGIFSKKSSHLTNAEEDFHKLKKKSLHFSSARPREFIIPAASVLCNVDNLENATKLNKKLHWELLDNKNELTEIEDDTDIETTDEELRHKLQGEIKQEQVTPHESPQQTPKHDDRDEQSNSLDKADKGESSQEVNYETQNIPSKIHKSKYYKYKLSKTIKSYPKSMKVNKHDPITHCSSAIDQKPFIIVLPKRQRGRPRKLENLLKATIKTKAGPRILKKRGRKPKKSIEFSESYDNNNSTECAAEPVIDKTRDTLVSEDDCALSAKQNEELLAEAPMQISNNCDVIPHQKEEQSRQGTYELNDEIKGQISFEDRNPAGFTRDHDISNEPVIKDVVASKNKDCNDAGKSLQISIKDGQNSNPESKKISKESNTKMSANGKPITLSLNSGNNCDDVSTTSGDSENKLLIISDGGPEEVNEKQREVRPEDKVSNKSKHLERLKERKSGSTRKKDKKYISLEDIGIKVRPFKGHLSTLRIPKVNKDNEQTNAWKLETYEELDKEQQWEEKVEQKIEREMNASTETVKTANKAFLSTYRIPKINKDAGLGKDHLEKTETCGKTSKEERREKIRESYHESKDKLSNNCKVTEAKGIDKTKHTWRPDNAGLKEKSEQSQKTYKQQRDNKCGNAGSNVINFDNKTEAGKRKLFHLEMYNDADHEDELANAEVNKQSSVCAERKLSECKVSEKESSCFTGKPAKLRRKSLNLPKKMLLTSSDDEEEAKDFDVSQTRKKTSLHRRILDSSCDEDVEVLGSKIKEKPTNKTNKPLQQRGKSMFVESTTDFHHNDERLTNIILTSHNSVKSTSCSETFDSERNNDVLSTSENIKFLETTVESIDRVTMLSVKHDSKDTGTKSTLKIRRKSLFIESSSSETLALDNTKLNDVVLDNTAHMKPGKDGDNLFESAHDLIKEKTIRNKNANMELKCSKVLKSRRTSMHAEPDCASDLKNRSEDLEKNNEVVKTTSINETSKQECSTNDTFDQENAADIKSKSTKREERSNSNGPINKDIDIGLVLDLNTKEDPVNTNKIMKDLNSSMEPLPIKPRRKSINHRRILDSSSDDNEPLMKKPLQIVNEIKPPVAAAELKRTKSRKRRVVKVLSTSRDAINSSANSSLQSENLTQIHSNSPSPFASPLHNHPIFNREVSTQSREFAASMPVTPNQQDDDKKFKEIDSKLHQIFQSPQYATDYKANHNTTTDSNIMEMLSTSLPPDAQGKSIVTNESLDSNRENDQSSANVDLNKPGQSAHTNAVDSIKLDIISTSLHDPQGVNVTLEETQPDINQENNQSSTNCNAILNNTTAVSHNCSEIKHLSLGSTEYRFEKVSDNVVNLFISRKRKRKRHVTEIV